MKEFAALFETKIFCHDSYHCGQNHDYLVGERPYLFKSHHYLITMARALYGN